MLTKIIVTVGPGMESHIEEIFSIAHVARFNFSHANYDYFKYLMRKIRNFNEDIAFLADLKGPEIRTKNVKTREIRKNQEVVIGEDFEVSYPNIVDYISPGDLINIDDGRILLKIIKVHENKIITKALNDATLEENKSINIPGRNIEIPALTKKDYEDLDFIKRHEFDFIAQSWVKRKEDIIMLKEYIPDVPIIAKIEHQEAIKNLDEILKESIGVMIARGDLGIETDIAYLPILQRKIMEKAMEHKKISIIATHFLRSMVYDPIPSRAEVNDIFCAIREKPDAVMLSEETAIGKYPLDAVKMMKKIIEVAEHYYFGEAREIIKENCTFEDVFIESRAKDNIKILCKNSKEKRKFAIIRGVFSA